jgi:PAS domain S-box-containing protein
MMTTSASLASSIDQAEIRFLVDKNADGIIVVDEDGIVLFANPATEQIFGRPPVSLIGSPVGIPLVSGETTEITVHRPGGDHVDVEIRVVDTRWGTQPARLASLRDVSARKALEERLRHAAKMEAVGRLSAGIAHDFNNLLTVVLGNLEHAQRQSDESVLLRSLDNATRGARRAAVLTERLLSFARRKALEPKVLNLNELVSSMSDLLQRTLGERITIRTTLASDLWDVEVDPTELETAIVNLAVNARDAMPAGGDVTIETANIELDATCAGLDLDISAGPYVVISVADAGTGMPPEVLNQAFEPFFTTKPDGQGTGLGLSQIYGFVKQSGGHVKLYSEPDIGTTAKIYLPRARTAASALSQPDCPKSNNPSPPGRPGETILVVEDHEDVRNYTVTSLKSLGYTVYEAGEAASALELLERKPNIRLLFTDLGLPGGMDGRDLANRAQQIRGDLHVLITTAYAGSALVHEGRLDRGIDLLTKPFTLSALAWRIRELLDRTDYRENPLAYILLVEDEVLLRMLITDALSGQGCRLEEAANFAEAIEKLRTLKDQFTAAIIDLGLPDRPGHELVATIRLLRPDIPIILATGLVEDDFSHRFAQDTRLRLLTKPFEATALVTTLAQLGVLVRTNENSEKHS